MLPAECLSALLQVCPSLAAGRNLCLAELVKVAKAVSGAASCGCLLTFDGALGIVWQVVHSRL